MKLKLETLVDSEQAIKELLNQDMPIQPSLKLTRVMDLMHNELVSFKKVRDGIIKKLGKEKNPGRGDFAIEPTDTETMIKFLEQEYELKQTEIDFNVETVTVKELGEKIMIKPVYLKLLLTFLLTE